MRRSIAMLQPGSKALSREDAMIRALVTIFVPYGAGT